MATHKPTGENEHGTAPPTTLAPRPPREGRPSRRYLPVLDVEGKTVGVRTRRGSVVRFPDKQQSKETSADIKKMTPVLSEVSRPSKPLWTPAPATQQKALTPVQHKVKMSLLQGQNTSLDWMKIPPIKIKVAVDKANSRSPNALNATDSQRNGNDSHLAPDGLTRKLPPLKVPGRMQSVRPSGLI